MYITNNLDKPIFVNGQELLPNVSKEFFEGIFGTNMIQSDCGSATITTEYSTRHIETSGDIKVIELASNDKYGMKLISVESA